MLPKTREILTAADERRRRTATAVSACRAAAQSLAVLLAAAALDRWLPLPVPLRFAAASLAVGLAAMAAVRWARVRCAGRPNLERAALDVESALPGAENALINAVQLERAAEGAALAVAEAARAEVVVRDLAPDARPDRAAVRRAAVAPTALAAALVAAVLLAPRAARYEAPRLLAPWTDHAPFTLTDFELRPLHATVAAGGSVVVQVRFGGRIPDSAEIVTDSAHSARSLPLDTPSADWQSVTLADIRAPLTFHVEAGPARSEIGRIEISTAQPRPSRTKKAGGASGEGKGRERRDRQQTAGSSNKSPKSATAARGGPGSDAGAGEGNGTSEATSTETRRSAAPGGWLANAGANGEMVHGDGTQGSGAGGVPPGRYPAEYRELVRDYFRAEGPR